MALYAQHGYGKGNKIDLAISSNDISGVILSPKSESPDNVLEYSQELFRKYPMAKIYFDPQFYICGLQGDVSAGKLLQYPYYVNGLTRANLSVPANLHRYTQSVIDFQNSLPVSGVLSPSICFDDFSGRESQTVITLAYEAIGMTDAANNLFISLSINESAFRNKDSMEDFLNVISLLDVKGFYVIIERASNIEKATTIDINVLSNIMKFVYTLSEINGFEVIMGYSDLISIPISAVGKLHFACGWYNNLKMFAESNFRPSSGGRRPRKRYTSGVLLNSILLIPEFATLNRMGLSTRIMSESPFNNIIYPSLTDTAWTDEVSCIHNWHVINKILKEIEQLTTVGEKLDLVTSKIMVAMNNYRLINERIPLDTKSNGSHLSGWIAAISNFRDQVGV